MKSPIKKKYLFGLVVLIGVGELFANIDSPYDNSKTPGILLPEAYNIALKALGSSSNGFHCVNAKINTRFSKDGEWYFTFCPTNSTAMPKWITVEFSGKTHVENFQPPR